MKGIVFTLLQQVVSKEHGERTWDALLESSGVSGVYTSVGTYSDDEITRLVDAAASALGIEGDDVLRWFGRKALPLLAELHPEVFEGHTSARSFVLTLNDVIHPAVRKIYPGAYAPDFDFDGTTDEVLRLGYTSKRGLCPFAEGLVIGSADYFNEEVGVVHDRCIRRGDERCVLACTFRPVESAG